MWTQGFFKQKVKGFRKYKRKQEIALGEKGVDVVGPLVNTG